ncbi:hypothetical protein [Bacillus wiedmannii]|nr:hypothetical protein [Bacillus wiedmannii]
MKKLYALLKTYRENWLQEGSPWLDTKEKPKHSDLKQQLINVNIKE